MCSLLRRAGAVVAYVRRMSGVWPEICPALEENPSWLVLS